MENPGRRLKSRDIQADDVTIGSDANSSPTSGVYVHLPFCAKLCPYCDFPVVVRGSEKHGPYLAALEKEWSARVDELAGTRVDSIYFGGGTPALISIESLGEIIERIRKSVAAGTRLEVTLEANPLQVTAERLNQWRDVGINRLSIGCQSFDESILKRLGRNHDSATALRALDDACNHWEGRLSIDLIFGTVGQDMRSWKRELGLLNERLEGLDHVSVYELTIEDRTVFGRRARKGEVLQISEELRVEMLTHLSEVLAAGGVSRYEVSNFAREGHESRHNMNVWHGGHYLGVGLGAHSFRFHDGRAIRRINQRLFKRYLQEPEIPAEEERLSAEVHWFERLFTGLRTARGISVQDLVDSFPSLRPEILVRTRKSLDDLEVRDWIREVRGRYIPTELGWRFADSLALEICENLGV